MPPPISRAFLSRPQASLTSLYNPDATLSRPQASLTSLYNPDTIVHSLLYLLSSITDAVVFTCRSKNHHHHLALTSIGLMVEFA
jgi:hypothetical protein